MFKLYFFFSLQNVHFFRERWTSLFSPEGYYLSQIWCKLVRGRTVCMVTLSSMRFFTPHCTVDLRSHEFLTYTTLNQRSWFPVFIFLYFTVKQNLLIQLFVSSSLFLLLFALSVSSHTHTFHSGKILMCFAVSFWCQFSHCWKTKLNYYSFFNKWNFLVADSIFNSQGHTCRSHLQAKKVCNFC